MVNRERRPNIGESLDNRSNVIERRRNERNNQIGIIGKYVKNVNLIDSVHVSRTIHNTVSLTSYYFYASMIDVIETIASTCVPENPVIPCP